VDKLPTRVRYAEGQRVRARDLSAEQEYLVALEQRHNLEQHAPGVVGGLHANDETIHAGVAIDEEGRLLVSGEDVDAAPAQGKCVDAWLIHRETPVRARHPGHASCGPGESDRTYEIAEVIVEDVDAASDLLTPSATAVYLGRSGCDQQDREAAFTSIVAAMVKDPADRSVMQVGPASVRDRDAFVVRTADATGALVPRIALDRLGNNRFTGTIVLEDYRYCDVVEGLNDEKVVLRATDPGTAGASLHYRIEPRVEQGQTLLDLHFFAGPVKLPEVLTLRPDVDPLVSIQQFNLSSHVIQLHIAKFDLAFQPLSQIAERALMQKPVQKREAVAQRASFTPCGGTLTIEAWPEWQAPEQKARRGCQSDVRVETAPPIRDPVGLSFQPAAAAPMPATMPAIYSIRTGDAKAPVEELRLNLGQSQENDPAVRLSIGAHDIATDPFREWLQVTGMCGVILPDPIDNAAAPVTMHATGTIARAPIDADLSDPNFTLLLKLALLAGLQQSVQATTQVTLTFKNVAPDGFIETRDAWSYDVEVQSSAPLPVTVSDAVEELTIDGTASTNPIPAGVTVPADLHVQHVAGVTPAGEMAIEVTCYGNRGTMLWWKTEPYAPTIPVLESPTIGLPGLPASLVENQQWNQDVVIANNDAQRDMTIISVNVGTFNGQNLPAGMELTETVPLQAGAAPSVTVTVTMVYQWQNTTVTRTLTRTETIHVVEEGIEAAVATPRSPRRRARTRRTKKGTKS
jgi:hypothetical protein